MKQNLSVNQFNNFAKLIEEYSGIRLGDERFRDLSLAVLVRAKDTGLPIDKYFRLLRSGLDEEELKRLVGYLTINETSFMRHEDQYVILREVVIPELLKAGKKEVNIWSAGCSTGEEAYSIAIILSEMMTGFKINILGTDIDREALKKAKRALYGRRSIRLLGDEQLKKYFKEISANKFVLNDNIRELVAFDSHNLQSLTAPSGYSNFDIIFCRNVVIYFNKDTVAKIVGLFYRSLADKGHLFLGPAESLYATSSAEFTPREFGKAYVYQRGLPEPQLVKGCSVGSTPEKFKVAETKAKSRLTDLAEVSIIFDRALEMYIGKNTKEALKEIGKVKTSDLKFNLLNAQVLLELDRTGEAEKVCSSILESKPMSGYPYFILGLAKLKQKNDLEALRNFKKAAYSLKDFGLPHYFLANIYRRSKNLKKAHHEYGKCNRILQKNQVDSIWKILSPQFSPEKVAKSCLNALNNKEEKRNAG